MQAKPVTANSIGVNCPHCGKLNELRTVFGTPTEKGYYIQTAASTTCLVCKKAFNYEIELKVNRV